MRSGGLTAGLYKVACACTLLIPPFLTHFRGIGEGLIDVVALCFLIHCISEGTWGWLGQAWVRCSGAWWGWIFFCSVMALAWGHTKPEATLQAFLVIRFLVFIAALQVWVLSDSPMRRWLCYVICGCCAYIVAQMLLQAVTGYNLYGYPRFHDGTLTGPNQRPWAAAPLSRLLLPVSMLLCAVIREGALSKGLKISGAAFVLLSAIFVLVLAGQRMPFLLFVLGLGICALLLRETRKIALAALGLSPVLVGCAYILSPRSFSHLVTLFYKQITHFGETIYAMLFDRAALMGAMHPGLGLGFDGFRHHCRDKVYYHDWLLVRSPAGDGYGGFFCAQHPHNHYLEALVSGGVLGFVLFCVMVFVWLLTLARPLFHQLSTSAARIEGAWRVGVLAAVFIHVWPVASTSSFVNMPLGGWFFLLLGAGLAYTPPACTAAKERI